MARVARRGRIEKRYLSKKGQKKETQNFLVSVTICWCLSDNALPDRLRRVSGSGGTKEKLSKWRVGWREAGGWRGDERWE